jgi:multiple sugar transport system ATP-binding protein
MAHVNIKQLRKTYDGRADVLAGLNLDIRDGEFCVLVGPSGCGKSTLLRMLCGLEEISGGELAIGGQVVNHLPPAERGIAMVFQSYALYPHMNVYKNMAFGLKVAGSSKSDIDRASAMRPPSSRSITCCSACRATLGRPAPARGHRPRHRAQPRLFLFDEPLSNLDAALRVQTRLEIAKLHRQLAATIVYVTHDQVEAMTLGDKIVVMHEGRIQQAGTPLELYQQPQNLFVAGFIGSPKMNFFQGVVTRCDDRGVQVEIAGGLRLLADVDPTGVQVGEAVTLGLRAEQIREGLGDGQPCTAWSTWWNTWAKPTSSTSAWRAAMTSWCAAMATAACTSASRWRSRSKATPSISSMPRAGAAPAQPGNLQSARRLDEA